MNESLYICFAHGVGPDPLTQRDEWNGGSITGW